MATMKQKWPQTLFYMTTSSLLKLANYTMHEGETDFSVSMRAMTKNGLGHISGTTSSPFNTCILGTSINTESI